MPAIRLIDIALWYCEACNILNVGFEDSSPLKDTRWCSYCRAMSKQRRLTTHFQTEED